MKVDFHVHSTASDGTLAPAELFAHAEEHGFTALALTDHDNTDGVAELLSAANHSPYGVRVVPGIELSIEPGVGFDKFHLLGLGIDPANVELRAFLRRILDGRNERNQRIIANFRRLGLEMDDIESYAHGEVLARPHFARWLLDHNVVSSVAEGFAKYLLPDSPPGTRCYEERWHPGQEESFRVIHAAGGICVMAHPKYWKREWKSVGCDFAAAERELVRLREAGLDGLESLYQANTPDENVNFTRIALKTGLIPSAGSDFHGSNKPTIPLGMEVSEDFIAPLLRRVAPDRSRQ